MGAPKGGKRPNAGRARGSTRLDNMRDDGTTVAEYTLAKIRTGVPLDVALACAGVPKSTYMTWLNHAARLSERIAIYPKTPLTAGERRLLDFAHAIDHATAEAEARSWANVDALAAGGLQTRRARRQTVTDADGRQSIHEMAETTTMLPDLAALRWQLENRYGRHRPLEVRVEAGKLTEDERADELRQAMIEFLAERRAALDVGTVDGNGSSPNGHTP